MAQGLERRSATETNQDRSLRAMAHIEPVSIPVSGGAVPRMQRVNVSDTVGQRVASNFFDYAQGILGEASRIKKERSLMDGQMAAHQGKTFDEVEMGGDKWALEGYRLVEAQTMASTLLIAQRAEIANGQYEMDPDTYRGAFMDRAESVLSSASDPRVGELAREQLLKQMPVLVDDHMQKHLTWKEQKNFESLEMAVDTISMDPTSADTLRSFAVGGEGSATAGLSEERRRDAVTSGIVRAFENDNPQAYAILSAQGLLKDLPVALQQKIKGAKNSFEQRNRQTYNAEFIKQEAALMHRISTGDLEPQQAMDAYADLMADHNMTITAAEAGAIYGEANQGVRTKKVNTALATQEAWMRGDRDTAVNLIRRSLTGTESGGNAGAFRTNKDGKSYAGLLQFGPDRLADYNRATGSSVTVEQFRFMNKEAQAQVENWHINDILDDIEAKGLDKAIGTTINGVTVTLSGMVAVAHLGGSGGLNKFLSSNGAYNPADQLGTHLSDYLRTHGNGVDLGPEAAAKASMERIQVLRDSAAIEAYELAQPQFDALDEAYRHDGIDEATWRQARQEVRDNLGIARTMETAKFEMQVTQEVAKAADEVLDEQRSLAAKARMEVAAERVASAIDSFSKGGGSQDDIVAANQAMLEERAAVREEYGIPLSADEEIAQYRSQAAAIKKATDARILFDEEQAQIDSAEMAGAVGELPKKLQDRALKQAQDRAMAAAKDSVAASQSTEEQAMTVFHESMTDYYAKSGVVDKNAERVINGFLSGGMVDKNGEPRQEYMSAVNQYISLLRRNPTVADKYVRTENRAALDAVVDMISDTGSTENMEERIAGAVRTIGVKQSQAPRIKTTAEFLADGATQRRIDSSVRNYIAKEEIGVLQAVTSSTARLAQVTNRSWFSPFGESDEENVSLIRDRVNEEVSQAHRRQPGLEPETLISGAARRVAERTPIIGGIAVPLPMGGPSAGEMFFGPRAADFADQDGAMNEAVMDYFRSDEFRAEYPFVDATTFSEFLPSWVPGSAAGSTAGALHTDVTGVRPFQTYYDQYSQGLVVQFALPNGGLSDAILLDTKQIGKEYIRKFTERAAK